jgi:hypothetical protein
MMTSAATASHMTARHRAVGGLPSGNSSGARVTMTANPGIQIHDASQAMPSPAGSDPGCVMSA